MPAGKAHRLIADRWHQPVADRMFVIIPANDHLMILPLGIAPRRGLVAQKQELVALRIVSKREAAVRTYPHFEMIGARAIRAGVGAH